MGFYGGAMTELSKLMSCILRTRPVQAGLRPTAEGFVPLDELAEVIARMPKWAWIGSDIVRQSARQDAKGRYELKEALIRATYKRTFKAEPLPPTATPPAEMFVAVEAAVAASAGSAGLTATADRYLRLEPTLSAAAGAAARHRAAPAVLRVKPPAVGAAGGLSAGVFLSGPDGLIVAESLPAAALSAVAEAELAPLLKAARYRSAYEGALQCPDDGPRERFALRLYELEPRDKVEADLIAGFADEMPPVRHRVLSALGIQGKAAAQKAAGAVYASPLAGTRMTARVFDALLAAFADENAPWVAVEMVKAVGEQTYDGELADRRDQAIAFLREAATSVYSEVAEEAEGALKKVTG